MSSPPVSPTPFVRMDEETQAEERDQSSPLYPHAEQNDDDDIVMVPVDGFVQDERMDQPEGVYEGPKLTEVPDYNNFIAENDLKVYKGHSDFDLELQQVSNSKWHFGKTKRGAIKFLYISIFAIIGSILRMMLAQLFGEECKNPGTVGWLKAGQPLCVTSEGEASIEGGIIFADLPANLLGSFIMGLMQATDTMDLPKTFPIAWLDAESPFQSYDIIHLAIKTGFCGSLTTFSSWNSEMVLMMLGADGDRGSLIFRGLLGYFIGVETALASFILGKNIAKYLHSIVNKTLQHEATETQKKRECGVYINTQLCDFERRFLSEFDMGEFEIRVNPVAAGYLARWRDSTREHRRVGNQMLPILTDIEYQVLVLDEDMEQEITVSAIMAKWDLEALNKWREVKRDLNIMPSPSVADKDGFRLGYAFSCAAAMNALLIIGVASLTYGDEYSVTYRTMSFAALLAPFGALLRWKISRWNGKWTKYSWFPLGTFAANVVGSLISATMIGVEYRLNSFQTLSFWKVGSSRAVKVGFAGSLSTVSSFIQEFASFLSSQYPVHGYTYVFCSLISCGVVGAACYSIVAHNLEPIVYYQNGKGYY